MKVAVNGVIPNEEEKKAGEKVANNYKRSLAEKLARENMEADGFDSKSMMSGFSGRGKSKGGTNPMNATTTSQKGNKAENYQLKLISSKLQDVS
jgi:hypothetical protein